MRLSSSRWRKRVRVTGGGCLAPRIRKDGRRLKTDKKQLAFLPGKNIVARTTTVVSLTKVCIYSLLGVVLAPAVLSRSILRATVSLAYRCAHPLLLTPLIISWRHVPNCPDAHSLRFRDKKSTSPRHVESATTRISSQISFQSYLGRTSMAFLSATTSHILVRVHLTTLCRSRVICSIETLFLCSPARR
ncbi:uncharacterized protein BO88DRAFT_126366 [Aspergillus vadensis CBS 113365]|uniref:Uncharacterized protein n=1 Tax=Aspergillus vadensis (strain CBS 113365 / IMI 142717 / IBT 24658) TaxID=1448311 RepID=A0A319B135_ASPVC|nr:hypothetical protein BO88DRAFT_126366 [Aspergillus vadensis CBS 113365]PYH66199.1 hypothetical protein BO88DRAFT_126366 [Aspergillus vadensis CBS 113365]